MWSRPALAVVRTSWDGVHGVVGPHVPDIALLETNLLHVRIMRDSGGTGPVDLVELHFILGCLTHALR